MHESIENTFIFAERQTLSHINLTIIPIACKIFKDAQKYCYVSFILLIFRRVSPPAKP